MKHWPLPAALCLAGCVNMSGLDGESRYACAAPSGVACDSVSGTYANALQHKLPSQGTASTPGADSARVAEGSNAPLASATAPPRPLLAASAPVAMPPPSEDPAGTALRSPARVLRLWTKAWEDADGDLWDQGYVYVQIDGGRWQLDHLQQRIRDAYMPLQPPPATPAAGNPAPAEPSAAAERPGEVVSPSAAPTPFGAFPAFNRPLSPPGQRQP